MENKNFKRVIKDFAWLQSKSPNERIPLGALYTLEIIKDHFDAHGGTFDEQGRASVGMSREQIDACYYDVINNMTRPAWIAFRILSRFGTKQAVQS